MRYLCFIREGVRNAAGFGYVVKAAKIFIENELRPLQARFERALIRGSRRKLSGLASTRLSPAYLAWGHSHLGVGRPSTGLDCSSDLRNRAFDELAIVCRHNCSMLP